MKLVLQRVANASVTIEGDVAGQIGGGLMVLCGVEHADTTKDSEFLAQKIVDLRIFSDDEGKMNLSLLDIKGEALIISQFTLFADWLKGRRPSFLKAAPPAQGEALYLHFVEQVKSKGVKVETGRFGADMKVSLLNDGPVTLILDSKEKFQ
ncbi:D-tyrosyl-tRNA(Tyr) deacylase [bacterium]|nr:D-tyrosyl-tRNA(Tyr) deacylase [bacterium]QQR56558.1 MAG: D-tyrosyl-tRNA(Tyr) deacylase [Candidatus Melainabacteria bacterium]